MADEVGYPFNQIPPKAFLVYAGGFAGEASLCGSLGVAAAAIGTVTDKETQNELVRDIIQWYRKHPFPQYQPADLNLATTVANSDLCYDSVGNWMKETGYAMGSDERKQRCAGVAAEIAKYTVELLNKTV